MLEVTSVCVCCDMYTFVARVQTFSQLSFCLMAKSITYFSLFYCLTFIFLSFFLCSIKGWHALLGYLWTQASFG